MIVTVTAQAKEWPMNEQHLCASRLANAMLAKIFRKMQKVIVTGEV